MEIQRWIEPDSSSQTAKNRVKSLCFHITVSNFEISASYVSYKDEHCPFLILWIVEPLHTTLFLFFNCEIYKT